MGYKTTQKETILVFLMKNKDKFVKADEIKKYLDKENYSVGLTTIYRQLNSLEEDNKVRIEVKDHTKYYQYIEDNCDGHFHLKCKKCGKEIHLDCEDFNDVSSHIKREY